MSAHRFLVTFALLFASSISVFAAETYTVKRGNNLTWISKQHEVGREAMILANEQMLSAAYDKYCGALSKEFRNRTKNKGSKKGGRFYCNDRFARAYANSIRPGMKLVIPESTAPASIEQTIIDIKGDNIALVIDVTGSMDDKRSRTAQFYHVALRKFKKIGGIYLYADGKVDKLRADGVERVVEKIDQSAGNYENTLGALREAAKESPDAIILLTDEPGDDWGDWSGAAGLPPVIAHCLPSQSYFYCRANLSRIARQTGGRYIEGFSSPTASRK